MYNLVVHKSFKYEIKPKVNYSLGRPLPRLKKKAKNNRRF